MESCSACGCSLCGRCDNGRGCCLVCSQKCDCGGCAFELGKAFGNEELRKSKAATKERYELIENEHARFKKFANFQEKRNCLMEKILQSVKSRELDHYWTYDWKIGGNGNLINCCRVS